MALITPNFKDMTDLQPLNGTYACEVETAEAGVSKSGGNKVIIGLKVMLDGGKSTKRTVHIPIDGRGVFRFDQFLRATHFNEAADALKRGENPPLDTNMFIGQKCRVVISPDKQQPDRDSVERFLREV